MGLIQLPQRHLTQPQYAAELDPLHWAFKDIVFAYSAGRGFTDGKHPKLAGTLTTFTTTKAGAKGKYLENTVPGNNAFFSNHTDHDTLGGVTLIGLVQPSSVSGQMTVVSKDAAGGGTNTPLGLLLDSGAVSLNRANAGFRVWKGVATLAANQLAVVAVTQGANIGTAPKFYIDGQFDTGAAVNLFGGSGTGAPIATTEGIKVSANTTFNNRFIGGIYGALVLNRECSAEEVAELSRNLWSIWKAPARRLWLVPSASSDGAGSASGSATVSGIGASVSAQPGTASGTSTVSGVGASTAASVASSSGTGTASGVGQAVIESVGSASGVATVSGVGTSGTGSSGSAAGSASVAGVGAAITASTGSGSGLALASGAGAATATSAGASSGTSTVSGVGDSVQAGAAVGNASGTSTVSGVGASVVAAVGSASGSSTVTGRGDSTGGEVEDFGGDDAPIIIRKRKKKTLREQPNKHLDYILNKSVEEFQGKVRRHTETLTIKGLVPKQPVSVDTPISKGNKELGLDKALSVPSLLDAQKDAEKVAQLLAEYQQQVRAMEDDEDLIMLIAEFYG